MSIELFVSRIGDRLCAALRDAGRTVELRAEHSDESSRYGLIAKARVTRVIPAIQAAFLDASMERDLFLHVSELLLPGEMLPLAGEPSVEPPAIQHRLREGQELVVQVNRESSSAKGDRATCWIGIPGRLLVFLPHGPRGGISRRIGETTERDRLEAILQDLAKEGEAFVARTAADGVSREALKTEADRLRQIWADVVSRSRSTRAPAVIHREPPLSIRLLRDAPSGQMQRVVFDDPDEFERASRFLRGIDSALASRLELYEESPSLFARYGLDEEIVRAMRPKVWLASGGYLFVEQTEALVSIDVNTGRSVRGSSQEDTCLETNLEAVAEVARQLRLRDLGGIIVVDFVDMELPENRQLLLERMSEALREDPSRTKIVDFSEIGLMQLTRKKTRSTLRAALTECCPRCQGQGSVLADGVAAAFARVRR